METINNKKNYSKVKILVLVFLIELHFHINLINKVSNHKIIQWNLVYNKNMLIKETFYWKISNN